MKMGKKVIAFVLLIAVILALIPAVSSLLGGGEFRLLESVASRLQGGKERGGWNAVGRSDDVAEEETGAETDSEKEGASFDLDALRTLTESIWENVDAEPLYELADNVIYNEEQPIYEGDVEKVLLVDPAVMAPQNLTLSIGGAKVSIAPSEDGCIYIEATNMTKLQAYAQEEAIVIVGTHSNLTTSDAEGSTVTLYLPEDYYLENTFVELGGGTLTFDFLEGNTIHLKVGAGVVHAAHMGADSLSLVCGAGQIVVDDMGANGISLEVGAGRIEVCADTMGLEGKCALGNLDITLKRAPSDYNLEVTCTVGEVNVDGVNYSGAAEKQVVDNGVQRNLRLSCTMGKVDVAFLSELTD